MLLSVLPGVMPKEDPNNGLLQPTGSLSYTFPPFERLTALLARENPARRYAPAGADRDTLPAETTSNQLLSFLPQIRGKAQRWTARCLSMDPEELQQGAPDHNE